GVMIEHRSLLNFVLSMQNITRIDSSDTLLAVTTVSFDIAGLELFLPLSVGARLVVAPLDTVVDGHQLSAGLKTYGATVMQATPITWRMLIEAGWSGNERLLALCGGEALSRELSNELTARVRELWNLYGPTETTIWSTARRVEKGSGPVYIGGPIAN